MGYYACGPNDIWSLGVILVNLTCGRNPWKSASLKDSTFRAYMNDRQFLKTILPLSDELNEILGMIFEIDPARRITLDELRQRIIHCPVFTQQPECTAPALDVIDEDFVDEDLEVFSPGSLSPASSLSDEGSMVSDDSDDSSVPSEADVAANVDVTFDVMDEHSTYDEMGPMDASKDFEPTSPYVHVVDPFAFTGVNEVVCTHPTLPTGHIPSGNVNYQEPSHHPLPLQSYPVSRPVIAKPAKSVHQFQFLGRLTPSSLNPFCPQPGNQRLPAIWRSF
jgi:serine/threonine protein kinase